MLVTDVAKRVDQSQDLDQSWALLVPGSKSAAAVEQFCEESVSVHTHLDFVLYPT